VGGDGTANEVMSGTVGTSNTLCVIPEGSGNDFVRSLYKKIPQSKQKAAAILERVKDFCETKIDCATANDGFFMNIASQTYTFQKYLNYFPNYLPISPLHFLFFLLE
jgi:diacylglycerol kinase family enzyme